MSTFGCEGKLVKTRKKHRCETCGRVIPSGKKALSFHGMYDGDWQNWYMCGFCADHDFTPYDEPVNEDAFNDWLYEEYGACPYGCKGKRYSNTWEWSENHEFATFECDECGKKWHIGIGWGR